MSSLLLMAVAGCAGAAASPSSTATPSPTPTPSPTAEPTPTPTPTQAPLIQGTVSFTGARTDPFVTSVVMVGTSGPSAPVQTNADGTYSIAGAAAGDYEVWILLSDIPDKIAGCTDVVVPKGWGVSLFMGTLRLTVTNATTLQQGIDNFHKHGLTPSALYAASPKVTLATGTTLTLDVVLTCK